MGEFIYKRFFIKTSSKSSHPQTQDVWCCSEANQMIQMKTDYHQPLS
jgi:hypothetical protein